MMKSLDLFVFVDALGWRLVEEHGVLADLLPLRNRCETVFGYSSTCDPTILTGKLPCEHGHFSCYVRASSGGSPFTSLGKYRRLPGRLAAHHRVRNFLSRHVARRHGFTGYFQLYGVPFTALPYLDYTEKRDIYEPGGILGGQPVIFEAWETSGKPWHRSDWRHPDQENFRQIERRVDEGEIELGYLFTAGLDAVMHAHGTRHPLVIRWLEAFERRLTRLHERALARYHDVRIHVFSDHGMTDTRQCSGMMPDWERELGLRYGHDYVAVWDSTMARFWFGENDRARHRALDWLQQRPEGRILTDTQLEQWGCLFPDRRYGEIFYLLEAGRIFVPSFMNRTKVTGMHGYDPAHPDSPGCWLTNRSGAEVAALKDIYPVMAAAATLPPGITLTGAQDPVNASPARQGATTTTR